MRLCIDASPLLVRSAGVKNYLYYWIQALREHSRVELFPRMASLGKLRHESFSPARLTVLHLSRLIGLDPFIGDAEIFHASNLVRSRPRKARLSATLHDLTAWRIPELHTQSTRRAEFHFAEKIAARADGLIAVSESTKRDAVEILNLSPDRITVIHSGVAEAFFTAAPKPAARPYILFVGTIEPRKNIDVLLDAFRPYRGDYDLVVAGSVGWAAKSTVGRVFKEARYLGYVSEAELPALTAGATAFVYPSLYEGFGFPVAQAMAAGVPVITSNVSSLPEVTGDTAILVDPCSSVELRAAIERLLSSSDLQRRLGEAGRARARAMFRWDLCARRSLEFFHGLLA